MEKYLWQKTLLELYSGYKTCIVSCDNKLTRLIRKAFGTHGSTYDQLDDMRLVVLRKKHCQYAKQMIEKALASIKPMTSSVLYWRYMRGRQFNEIANEMNIPIRQVFRKYDKEMSHFASSLATQGYTTEVIEEEFGADSYFSYAYDRLCTKNANVSKQPIVTCLISLDVANDTTSKKNTKSKQHAYKSLEC